LGAHCAYRGRHLLLAAGRRAGAGACHDVTVRCGSTLVCASLPLSKATVGCASRQGAVCGRAVARR
jgi:hypothetical protein